MKRLAGLTITAFLVLSATPAWCLDGNIGLYFGDDCDAYLPPGCRIQMHVYGSLLGASSAGITGAEYSIRLAPVQTNSNYLFSETFAPTALVIGSGALTGVTHGVNVSFPECQTGNGGRVLLETIDILRLPTSTDFEVVLQTVKHDRPSNAFFQCPLFTLCDAPVYTKVCLGSNLTTCPNPEPPFANNATCSTSGQAFINGRECCLSCVGVAPDCTVGAQPSAWSGVKALYRN